MSALYKVTTKEDTFSKNSVTIKIEAVNHDDQEISEDAAFYFVLLASIYAEFKVKLSAYGLGINEYLNEEYKIQNTVPEFEEYINALAKFLELKNGKMLEHFNEKERINSWLDIKVENLDRDEYDCVMADVVITATKEEFLEPLKAIKEADIYFDDYQLNPTHT